LNSGLFPRMVLVLAALGVATLIGACSSAPELEKVQTTDQELSRPTCNSAFETWQCTNEGVGGSSVCGCQSLTGPACTVPGTTCTACVDQGSCSSATPIARPAGMSACTAGLRINSGYVWLCPTSTVLPSGIFAAESQQFCSYCVGMPTQSGWKFVYQPIPQASDCDGSPVCEPGTGCSGSCGFKCGVRC